MKYFVRTSLVAGMMAFALYVTAQDDDHTVTDPGGRTYLFPTLPQVFPANKTLLSSIESRGDLWVLIDASIHAYQ
ncbi:MAG: hypothetical protein IPF78_01295 [Flavobacteriales bacterium]|nr:hypothetical protein [Flavobacteriales bacterium]